MNLILFTEKINSRLHYAAKEIAVRIGLNLELITTDQEEFKSKNGVKINYSNHVIPDSFQILPTGLLSEKSISNKNIDWFEFEKSLYAHHWCDYSEYFEFVFCESLYWN